jgi:hypothetical protein
MSRSILVLLVAAGCESKDLTLTPIEDGEVAETGLSEEEEEALDAIWGNASLVIGAPDSGDFLPLGEAAAFQAYVVDEAGTVLDFDEITWSSDLDATWGPVGSSFVDGTLSAGTHTLTAKAELPNGDRLSTAVAGILVQHEDAGTYVGNVMMDMTLSYDGTDYTVTCIGATVLVVDALGETAEGDSSCILSLFGYDLEAAQELELVVDDGDISGEVAMDFEYFTYDFTADGEVGGGEIEAAWEDDVYGYAQVAGSLSASRITRTTDVE